MSTIVLQSSDREITSDLGEVLFRASIYDISLVIGSTMAEYYRAHPEGSGGTKLEMYGECAKALNEAFKPSQPLTAGAAMSLAEKVEGEIVSLKKTVKPPIPQTT